MWLLPCSQGWLPSLLSSWVKSTTRHSPAPGPLNLPFQLENSSFRYPEDNQPPSLYSSLYTNVPSPKSPLLSIPSKPAPLLPRALSPLPCFVLQGTSPLNIICICVCPVHCSPSPSNMEPHQGKASICFVSGLRKLLRVVILHLVCTWVSPGEPKPHLKPIKSEFLGWGSGTRIVQIPQVIPICRQMGNHCSSSARLRDVQFRLGE